MTHYQKLTTMIFRIIGAFFLIAGALATLTSLLLSFSSEISLALSVSFTVCRQ
jgi:hypothetical protein